MNHEWQGSRIPAPVSRVKQARLIRGLTVKQLATASSLSQRFIRKVERGERGLSSLSCECLADALDCSTDYLLGRWTWQREVEHQRRLAVEAASRLGANVVAFQKKPAAG